MMHILNEVTARFGSYFNLYISITLSSALPKNCQQILEVISGGNGNIYLFCTVSQEPLPAL